MFRRDLLSVSRILCTRLMWISRSTTARCWQFESRQCWAPSSFTSWSDSPRADWPSLATCVGKTPKTVHWHDLPHGLAVFSTVTVNTGSISRHKNRQVNSRLHSRAEDRSRLFRVSHANARRTGHFFLGVPIPSEFQRDNPLPEKCTVSPGKNAMIHH